MREGWIAKRLGDISVINYGYTAKASFDGEGPKFIRITDIQDDSVDWTTVPTCPISEKDFDRHQLFDNDIVFARTGATTGKSYLLTSPPESVAASYLIRLRLNDSEVLASYVSLFFQTRAYWAAISRGLSGSAQGGFNASKLAALAIPLPPPPEQKRIVAILDEAFAGIATAVANTEKNLANARELFDSGLDSAITGKLAQDWRRAHPDTESASIHLKNTLSQRHSHWKGTGKYKEPKFPVTNKPLDIPNSWTLASPEQISTHIVDCSHSTPKWAKSGVLCLRTTNFKPGFLDLESVRFVSEETYNERIMRLEPQPGDVLYSREGGILGIACIIPKQLKTCLGQRMMLFRLDTDIVSPEYFTGVLNSRLILSEVKRLTGGAASPHLNIRDIRTFPIPLPPIAEQHEIVAQLNTIAAKTNRLESLYQHKLTTLAELKQSLLHKAFSGELTSQSVSALQEAVA